MYGELAGLVKSCVLKSCLTGQGPGPISQRPHTEITQALLSISESRKIPVWHGERTLYWGKTCQLFTSQLSFILINLRIYIFFLLTK
jgi:hypothetical protein